MKRQSCGLSWRRSKQRRVFESAVVSMCYGPTPCKQSTRRSTGQDLRTRSNRTARCFSFSVLAFYTDCGAKTREVLNRYMAQAPESVSPSTGCYSGNAKQKHDEREAGVVRPLAPDTYHEGYPERLRQIHSTTHTYFHLGAAAPKIPAKNTTEKNSWTAASMTTHTYIIITLTTPAAPYLHLRRKSAS